MLRQRVPKIFSAILETAGELFAKEKEQTDWMKNFANQARSPEEPSRFLLFTGG
jgi:hypothetical protein